jgi:APA family basic amino acid/polyamine antiporter
VTIAPDRTLDRRLGPFDGAALIVSNVIGGGILFTPPQIAAAVPAALPFLSTWAAGGLLAFAGAMAYAELAALRPRAGGEYVYLREALGSLAAFLSGWTSFVAGFSGAIATSAVVLASYLGRFVPAAGNSTPFVVMPIVPGTLTITVSAQTVIALAAIAGMAWIHLRGVGPGRIVGNVLATLKVSALLLFIALGFAIGQGSRTHFAQHGAATTKGWLLALIPVMFTYSGWNAASYIAEEIRMPGRNVPRALALGTGAVVVLYLLLNALYLYVVPVDQLAAVKGSMLDLVADRLLGETAGNIMAVVSIVSLLASISAMTFAGPRVYFAMGRDGVFLPAAAAVHPRYRTPAVSILAQAAWSAILVLTAGADALVTYTGFAIVLFSGIAVVSLFVLRAREPRADRPFRAWGYPLAPAVYVLASAAILVNAIVGQPATTRNGAMVILAGVPLYLVFRKKGQSAIE